MSLRQYVARRLAYSLPVVLVVITISFLLLRLARGDPAALMAGEGASPEYVETLRREFGLDRPLHEQYFIYLFALFRGNWGFSLTYNRPVLEVISQRIPQTVLLVVTGLSLAIFVGVTLGIVAARSPHSAKDSAITSASLLFYSIPVFWLAQLFILVMGVYLRIFPIFGMYTIGLTPYSLEWGLDVIWHLILPATTLALAFLAVYARLTRAGLLEVLGMNFIVAARAKGVPEEQVIRKHALKSALLPVVTVAGIQFGLAVAGVVLTETVYAWPGIGRLLTEAVFFRDYPLIMGIFIIVSLSVVIANLVTDVIYAVIDPRITYR